MTVIYKDENYNRILGFNPDSENTQLNFGGKNNILFCEENVKLKDSKITLAGDNSLVYLSSGVTDYRIDAFAGNNSVLYIGSNFYANSLVELVLSEQKHLFIGEACLFSSGISFRNADPHLIYDCDTKLRINPTKSIFVGDHVWIGQNVTILKGTQIDSGSIVGAGTVLSNKHIGHNESWAGNPGRLIRKNVFWDNKCVHRFDTENTNESLDYRNYGSEGAEWWNFRYSEQDVIEWDEIDSKFSEDIDCEEKLNFIFKLNNSYKKNRFVHSG